MVNLGTLVVRMALEMKRYKDDLAQSVNDTKRAMDENRRATDALTTSSRNLGDQATKTARNVKDLAGAIQEGDYARAGMEAAEMAAGFGRAGIAASALGAAVGVVASAVVAYGVVSYKAHQEQQRHADVLALTGNAAGLLATDINAAARSVADSSSVMVGRAREIAEGLAATGKIGSTAMVTLTGAAESFARATGQKRESVVADFSRMAGGVADWAAKTNEKYNFLTAVQWNHIRALEEQGRRQEAMIVTGEALKKHMDGVGQNLGFLQRAWAAMGRAASAAWDAALNIGRADTTQSRLETATERVTLLRNRLKERQERGQPAGLIERDEQLLAIALQAQAELQETERLERRAASAKAATADAEREKIKLAQEWTTEVTRGMSAQERLEARIKDIRDRGAAAGASQVDIERLVQQARDESARSTGRSSSATRRLTDEERALAEQRRRDLEVGVLRNRMAGEAFAQREREAEAVRRNSFAFLADQEKQIRAAYDGAAAAEAQAVQFGLSRTQLAELTLAKLEDARAQALLSATTLDDVRVLDAQVDAQKRVVAAMRDLDSKEALAKATREHRDAWDKTADHISQSLTDALMRGFEQGEGFADNLGKSVVNMFKTWVAKTIADTIKNAIMGALAQTQWGQLISSFTGGGGGGINWGQIASAGYKYMTGGSAAAGGTTLVGADAAMTGSTYTGGTISSAGAGGASWGAIAGWAVAAVAAVYVGSSLYDKGYTRENLMEYGGSMYEMHLSNAVYKGFKMVGVNEKWAQVLSGSVFHSHLMGGYEKMAGVRGYFDGAGGIATDQFSYIKRGQLASTLGASDKVISSALDTQRSQDLVRSLRMVQDQTEALARAMGYSGEAIRNFVGGVTIDLKGLSREEAIKRMSEELQELQYRMLETAGISREMFDDVMATLNNAMDRAGLSVSSISDLIAQGMTNRLGRQELGDQMADLIIGGIYSAIASGPADMVAQAFSTQIIQPLLTAALTGAPIAGVVSQQAIAGVVATAQQAAAQLNAIFSDAGFRQAIADVQSAIRQVSTISVQPARHVRAFGTAARLASEEARRAAEEAKRAAEEMRRRWRDVSDSIIDEIARIKGEALGNTRDGLAFAQAQFVTATAAARAGDMNAAQSLPGLSQALDRIAEQVSTSEGDRRAIQGWTIRSLAETNAIISQWAGGTATLPQVPSGSTNPSVPQIPTVNPAAQLSSDQTLSELRLIRGLLFAIEGHTSDLKEKFDLVSNSGAWIRTKEVAA